MRTFKHNNSGQGDLREMVVAAGIGQYLAPMAIQFMNFLPSTTDPYAPGVIEIVKGMQRLLNKRGAKLAVDGGMGQKTVLAMSKYAGRLWYDKSWSQIYGDIMNGVPWEGWQRESRAKVQDGLDGVYEELGAGVTIPIVNVPIYRPGTIPMAEIQIAINRLVPSYTNPDFFMVSVDGKIGPKTVEMLKMLAGDSPELAKTLASRTALLVPITVVQDAPIVLANLRAMADGKGIIPLPLRPVGPFNPGDKAAPPKPPAGTPGLPSSGVMEMLMSPIGIAALAVGGLLIYKSTKKKGR